MSEPQDLFCEWCDEPCTADDWNPLAQALMCPRCLEFLAEQLPADKEPAL